MREKKLKLSARKFDYKWVMFALCFAMTFVGMGFCSSNTSLYMGGITEALGIKRTVFSITDTLRFLTTALVTAFFGSLVHKFGAKKLIMTGYVFLILSVLIKSVTTSILWFYVAGCFLGIGFSFASTSMVGSVVNRWFTENRGTATGLALAGNGLGGAVAAQIVTPMIYNPQNPFGYRTAYRMVAVVLVILLVLMALFFKERPDNSPTTPVTKHKKSRGASWVGIDFAIIKRKPYFYITCVMIFFTGLVLQGIGNVAAVYMKDIGFDMTYVAAILSLGSILLTVSKIFVGMFYDRFGLKKVAFMCDIFALVTMLSLVLMNNSVLGMIFAMTYAIVHAFALPLETVMLPLFANDMFGDKSYDKVVGVLVAVNYAGYTMGIPLVNLSFDLLGSYRPVFVICTVIMIAVTIGFRCVCNVSDKYKAEAIANAAGEPGFNA